jgi:hypothetical protein
MLGGINNSLFFQGLGGFIVFPVFILLLRWAFPTKKDQAAKVERRALKKSLRALKRK